MIILVSSEEEIENAKSKDKIIAKCNHCGSHFPVAKNNYLSMLSANKNNTNRKNSYSFCSRKCLGEHKTLNNTTKCNCKQCNIEFIKTNKEIQNTKNNFCSKSCAATYNNTHKTKGTRVSKLEIWLQTKLRELYPNHKIIFNGKEAINSELDIYFPDLKLAFELNGIFHYEPIYGENKLDQIKNNDNRKFQACIEQGISLCIIDTSKQKLFKEKSSLEFLNIITTIVSNK